MILSARLAPRLAVLGALAVIAAPGVVHAQEEKRQVVKIGSLAPEGTPWAESLQTLKTEIQKASGGSIRVKIYLNGRQGDESAMLEKIAADKLHGGGFTTSGLADLVPELSILELPFLFENDAEADHVMDEVIHEALARKLEAKGLHLYIWAVNGWVDFGSSTGPIRSLDDIRASKPYARPSVARRGFWEACGVTPADVAVPAVAGKLKDGEIDAYMTTPLFAAASQWWSTTKHWTDSNHVYQPAVVAFDLEWWKALPDEVRAHLTKLAPKLQAKARADVRGLDADLMAMFRKRGITVRSLGSADRAAMKKATAGIAKKLIGAGAFEADLLAKVEGALTELRKARGPKKSPTELQLETADASFEARPDMAELRKGREALSAIVMRERNNFEALWRLAKVHFFLGHYGAEGDRLETYDKGVEWAKRAIAANARRVEGHFWLAVLYGVYGQTKGITSSLFLVDDMEEALERAIKIDPKFDGGGPERIYGRLYFKLPWIAGGDNDKAVEHLRQALEHDPTMPLNYTYLAEVLIDEDEEDEARRLLRKLIGMTPSPRWAAEHEEALPEARALLESID